MQVLLSGKSLKVFMERLNSILRVGERVEVSILKRKGKNVYIVEIKGSIFEALFSKDIKSKTVVAKVEAIKPEVVLKSDEHDIEIKLMLHEKKNVEQSIEKSGKLDGQRFVILLKNSKEEISSRFSKGETLVAEIVAERSGNKYVLKIKGSIFEALSKIRGIGKGDKIALVVESVKPDIVLKTINGGADFIEFIPASRVFKGSEKFLMDRDELGKLLIKLEQIPVELEKALDSSNFKEVFEITKVNSALVERFLEPFETLKKTIEFILERLTSKGMVEGAGFEEEPVLSFNGEKTEGSENNNRVIISLKSVSESVYRKTRATSMNERLESGKLILGKKELKPDAILKFIQAVVESVDGKELGRIFGVQSVDKIESDLRYSLSLLLPVVIHPGSRVEGDEEVSGDNKGLIALLKQIAEKVDLILRSGKALKGSLFEPSLLSKNKDRGSVKALESVVREKSAEFSKILREIHVKSSFGVDVEVIKNMLKQAHSKFAESDLFIQIPIVLNKSEETIFVKGEKDDENNTGARGKRKFRVRIASNSERTGFFQIDGVCIDGKIACSIGFEKDDMLENFKSKIEDLKFSLGDNVSLNVYLIKKIPKLVRKQLDIKT